MKKTLAVLLIVLFFVGFVGCFKEEAKQEDEVKAEEIYTPQENEPREKDPPKQEKALEIPIFSAENLPDEPLMTVEMLDWIPGESSKQEVIKLLDKMTSTTQFVRYFIKTPDEITQMSALSKYSFFLDLLHEKVIGPVASTSIEYQIDVLVTDPPIPDCLTQDEIDYLNGLVLGRADHNIYRLDDIEGYIGGLFGSSRVKFRTGVYPGYEDEEGVFALLHRAVMLFISRRRGVR